jgi:hypothetical protein
MAGDASKIVHVQVEHLCDDCILVRVGARGPFPAPYRYSVTVVERDGFAEPVGFDHKDPTPSEFETVIRKINKVTGKLVAYWRAGPPPIRYVQIDPGLIKGRILMASQVDRSHLSKTHIPSPARAQKRDGSINMKIVETDYKKAVSAFSSGKESLLNVERVVYADGSVVDMFHHIATSALKG